MQRNVLGNAMVLMAAVSGCLAGGPGAPTASDGGHSMDGHSHGMAMEALSGVKIKAKDCVQGGGNSVYSGPLYQSKVGPFDSADQNPEVGNPLIGAYGVPNTGPANGIWHVAVHCATYVFDGEEHRDFQMGWVAQLIQRPAWDTWGLPRIEFMVADLSFNVPAFLAQAQEATEGAEISANLDATVSWMVPQRYMHVVMTDEHHGTFDFTAELHKQYGTKESEMMRFWMLPRVDGQHTHGFVSSEAAADPILYRPVAVDIYDTANGKGVRLAGESAGTFLHLQDLENPGENHVGNPLGHYQDGFDRTIILGPQPDGITFDTTWTH